MADRITDKQIYQKLMNHNAWTKGTLLDLDSLGAGGSKQHLIIANTQTYLGYLMTNSQLWELIDAIGKYESNNHLQRQEPIKIFMAEYERLDKPNEKPNHYFIKDLFKNEGFKLGESLEGIFFA